MLALCLPESGEHDLGEVSFLTASQGKDFATTQVQGNGSSLNKTKEGAVQCLLISCALLSCPGMKIERWVGFCFFFSFFSFLQIRSYIPYLLNLIFLIDIFFSSVVVALNQN